MKLWTLTNAHVYSEVLKSSLTRYYLTAGATSEHVIIDHHWPMSYWQNRREILSIAERFRCRVISPYENMGGHGGYKWGLAQLPLKDEDVVIIFDGDASLATYRRVS